MIVVTNGEGGSDTEATRIASGGNTASDRSGDVSATVSGGTPRPHVPMEPTPRPWQWNSGRPDILARAEHPADGGEYWFTVAEVAPTNAIERRGCGRSGENAALIVRAVNSYEAHEAVVRAARAALADLDARQCYDDDEEHDRCERTIVALRAALAALDSATRSDGGSER